MQRNTLATSHETLKNTETYQFMQQLQNAMGVNATQHGKVPGAYGEFGHDATTPIPNKSDLTARLLIILNSLLS